MRSSSYVPVSRIYLLSNTNKSCGVDKIPAHLLKETVDGSAVLVGMLFNLSSKEPRGGIQPGLSLQSVAENLGQGVIPANVNFKDNSLN